VQHIRLACAWAGIRLSSYEAHWRRWPDFRRRVAEAKAFASLRLEAGREAWAEEPVVDWEAVEALTPPTIAESLRTARRHQSRFS